MSLSIVILAAGQGTRMRSDLPKVLHLVAGRPMLEHVIDTARALEADAIHVVYGHGGDTVRAELAHCPVNWVEQEQQLGTGHAVQQALPRLPDTGTVLVLYGDVPLIEASTLRRLLACADERGIGLLTAELADPHGYGRIVRDTAGNVVRIVEQKDADPAEQTIGEINTGIVAAPAARLRQWLARLQNNNSQGEYYLTDIIAMAVADGMAVRASQPADVLEIMGVNDKLQLSVIERAFQRRQAEHLMREGLTLVDPARFDLRGRLTVGRDVTIDVNAVLIGDVELGDRVRIGPNAVIANSRIGDDVVIFAHCVIEEAIVGNDARIGPFARLRPEARLAEHVHVGNFVEIKKADLGPRSKVNHLSYVGDSTVGRDVNIGAGTITCNYDGANKHRTVIEDGAFIGSDTQLVAPVTVGRGATIGAGSTITQDAPAGELTLSRATQQTIEGWQRPEKKPKT
ncbi:MAG: bifunctional UDP-N-acetylglucosamine diphosphorylase/glucosamine-1-phosphate N-acetyltransferase GlmU [Gammaproteobacteria bacterium]